jgi:peptidoglycan hydrolase-like protein with peptidoglycan-binding domain
MSNLTGNGLVEFCKTKLGTPYVYGAKGSYGVLTQSRLNSLIQAYQDVFSNIYITKARRLVGKICTDCSGLPAWYTGKMLGSYQLYSTAYTRIPVANYKDFANGVIVWRSGHVGVFCWIDGKPYVLEAKGIDYGTVLSEFVPSKWKYGLTFKYITYDYSTNLSSNATWKGSNPYKEPTETIYKGCTGNGVKWVQWELVETGFDIKIDRDFGPVTEKAVKAYQQSCKIKVDGKVGEITRAAFKTD